MEVILILPILLTFFIGLFLMPFWIRKTKEIGLIWEDMNKPGHPKNVAGSGGVIILLAFIVGVLSYIAIKTFYFQSKENLVEIFASLSVILIIAFIGLIDDIFGWRRGGLSIKSRLILLSFATIPLVVINAGESIIMGMDIGWLYPVVLIPIGIIGASTTFNFLAGYNGLESSQGILILSALSLITYLNGDGWLSILSFVMITGLLVFYIFNKNPAKIFPGDILTYSTGALIAVIAILGNIEKIAIFFFIPYVFETILKIRGRLKKESFGKVNPDGSLEMPYEKIYGLEHLAIAVLKKIKPNKKVYENDVVWAINLFQILVIIIGLVLNKLNLL